MTYERIDARGCRAMRANACEWRPVDDTQNMWMPECGAQWQLFPIGGPKDNEWITCPFCGGYLVEFKRA